MLTVGFWNIERATDPESERGAFVISKINEWVGMDPRPEVIILCEVTQRGQDLADDLDEETAYQTAFIEAADQAGGVSPCSFLVMVHDDFMFDTLPTGGSMRRPYIHITCGPYHLAGMHATADQGQKALDDICDTATDFRDGQMIIGDMNLPEDKDLPSDLEAWKRNYIAPTGYAFHFPNYPTYRSKRSGRFRTLDYVLVRSGRAVRQASAPQHSLADFAVIDHAPIAFTIE